MTDAPAWKKELDAIVGARHGGAAAAVLPRLQALAARHPGAAEIQRQIAWTYDVLGQAAAAVPHYERAIDLGLEGPALADALLGLGSSLRCLGEFTRAETVLRDGRARFSDQREFDVFLAMVLHNLGRHAEAMRLALLVIADTADDPGLNAYQRAIRFYADQLDRRWA